MEPFRESFSQYVLGTEKKAISRFQKCPFTNLPAGSLQLWDCAVCYEE